MYRAPILYRIGRIGTQTNRTKKRDKCYIVPIDYVCIIIVDKRTGENEMKTIKEFNEKYYSDGIRIEKFLHDGKPSYDLTILWTWGKNDTDPIRHYIGSVDSIDEADKKAEEYLEYAGSGDN